jgi:hypothetical protein
MKLFGWLAMLVVGALIWLRRFLVYGTGVIGVAGMPDDFAIWGKWLGNIPPPAYDLAALALIIVGTVQTYRWFAARREPVAAPEIKAANPARLAGDHKHEDRLQDKQDLERIRLTGVQAIPDWPIHELFSHIDPDVLEIKRGDADSHDRWDIVGDEIRDALALGRLAIWGRPVEKRPNALVEQRPVLRLIDRSYWHSGEFSYWFFDDTERRREHTYVPHGSTLPQYTDLRVNRAEALAVWPAGHVSSERSNLPLLDLFKLAEKNYAWDFTSSHSLHELDFLYGLRQDGSFGTLTFLGKTNRNSFESLTRNELLVQIHAEHWRDYEIDHRKAVQEQDNFYMWTLNKRAGAENMRAGGYADLHIDREQAIRWLQNSADSYKGRTKR